MILVDAQSVAASRPGKPLFDDVSVTLSTGDRIGVVGLNGCGKSTLLRMIAGSAEPERGVVRRGRDVRIVALDQNASLPTGTVRAVVGSGWEVASILDRLGMTALIDADVSTLSGGQVKRVALAQALVRGDECDLLILDEPTNHLDIDAISWLEDWLDSFRGGLVLVTHDRHVLDRVTTRVLELDRGRGYLYDGGYDGYLAKRAERDEQAAAAETERRNLARTELAWLRRGAPARTRKPKARVDAATKIVEGRAVAPARAAELDLANATPSVSKSDGAKGAQRGWGTAGVAKRFPDTPRLGDKVVELENVGHRWGADPDLFTGLDLMLDNRERLGVVGPNGGGKSTLLDIMSLRLKPTTGSVAHGSTVRMGYYDQTGTKLDLKQRVRDAVAGSTRSPDWRDAALLEQFWFNDDAQWAPIELLSGGERRRLQLLLVLATHPNVLLLDEPTNDLDLDTLRVLEDFLDEWPGALVVVSHDRAFLERTVTDVIVVDGSGNSSRRPGGYGAWERDRRAARAVGGATSRRSAGSTSSPRSKVKDERAARSPSTLRRLVKEAEKQLASLDKRHAVLQSDLSDAGERSDHQALAAIGVELAKVDSEKQAVEQSWLELTDELDRG